MEFRNHTPFPALAFEGIDTHNKPFHVVVLRQTLTWDDEGQLEYVDEQAPLNTTDLYFGEINNSEVLQESDLCHHKPHCDVMVNATAYAPKGQPQRHFEVRLRLTRPNEVGSLALPEPPQGLNPLQKPSLQAQRAWAKQYEKRQKEFQPDSVLLDKSLRVLGERWFVRRFWPRRVLATLIRWISLGTLRLSTWRLTKSQKTRSVPLRANLAFGGQCQVEALDKAAKRIAKRHHLKPQQRAEFPRSIALEALSANPVGCGWARHWYLRATQTKRIPAPQIEVPNRPVKMRHFTRAQTGKLKEEAAAALVAGLGIRPKGHPDRARLVGTIDDDFINGDTWLPKDFDFAVWNAAWPDQQTRHLQGDETIELTNLCRPDSLGARYDRQGNSYLRLELPRHDCFALLRFNNGEMSDLPLAIDTLIVEPETQTLTLVWRQIFKKDPTQSIRVTEARMRTFAKRDAQKTAIAAWKKISRQAEAS